MTPPRRKFTRDFKASALSRLESGFSLDHVALEYGLSPRLLARWQREMRCYGPQAFSGHGKSRLRTQPKTQAVTLRLTEEEYEDLTTASSSTGAPSISAFARSRMLEAASEAVSDPSLHQVEKEIDRLLATIQDIMQILNNLHAGRHA